MSDIRMELSRQMVHLSGVVFIIMAQFIGRELAIVYLSMIALFFFIYSWYVRTQEKKLENLLGKMESKFRDLTLKLERKHVVNPFSGAMFFYIGCALTFFMIPSLAVASAACAMLAVGDALSTLAGKKFGKRKIGAKTLEGSFACFAGALAAGIFFVSPAIAVAGAVAATLAELVPRIDDNLVIPIVAGLAMYGISFLA